MPLALETSAGQKDMGQRWRLRTPPLQERVHHSDYQWSNKRDSDCLKIGHRNLHRIWLSLNSFSGTVPFSLDLLE